ncbi:HK97 family phage major capsid protein [Amycolatopsis echigonensis]|uniref:HK97 family phage major capsid protein n=1 Tax=Amycolatopsis echigonensis TaxID=2576905 RepID=A0A2N3WPW9_9PSEU|nr:phage major capsid protein [Amycolatopsis niigatensis]PKV95918.1 HK97 family phage major capsid protein [Amycolatopsis niigatensis]
MANINLLQWVPYEYDPNVIQRVKQTSAVINFGQNVTMGSEAKSIPRSGGARAQAMSAGSNYSTDNTANDAVWLYAQKYGGALPVNEEDLNDSLADVVNTKLNDFTTSTMIQFDNHSLGVTGAKGSVTLADGTHPQFDSLYYILTQTDPVTGYQANANITQGPSGGITYDSLRAPLKAVETGNYFQPNNIAIIAHPAFADTLRGIKDSNQRPIFVESSNGTAGGGQGGPSMTLFGHPLQWSLGCRLSGAPTDQPTGHPFLVVCSRDYLIYGTRQPLAHQEIDGLTGVGALSDSFYLKTQMRRAFVPGHQNAFGLLVDTSQ